MIWRNYVTVTLCIQSGAAWKAAFLSTLASWLSPVTFARIGLSFFHLKNCLMSAVLLQNAFDVTSPFGVQSLLPFKQIVDGFCLPVFRYTVLLLSFRLVVLDSLCWNSRSSRRTRNPSCWLSPGGATCVINLMYVELIIIIIIYYCAKRQHINIKKLTHNS